MGDIFITKLATKLLQVSKNGITFAPAYRAMAG